jgi:hypothetical protein
MAWAAAVIFLRQLLWVYWKLQYLEVLSSFSPPRPRAVATDHNSAMATRALDAPLEPATIFPDRQRGCLACRRDSNSLRTDISIATIHHRVFMLVWLTSSISSPLGNFGPHFDLLDNLSLLGQVGSSYWTLKLRHVNLNRFLFLDWVRFSFVFVKLTFFLYYVNRWSWYFFLNASLGWLSWSISI